MIRLQRETLAAHPTPPATPLEALAHVLAVFTDEPDEMVVITATTRIYPEAPWTGLRLGDLRRVLDDHAHALAERIRAWEHGATTLLPLERGAAKGAANLIDPEVPSA
ncbi:hypothetical protein ACF1DV_25895 [Streptomyces achromogenes]|uniref:hypothetical protein n=1 Tax=Streptomyces achromogenes TaxID=67255 RepID=UPI0036FBD598